MANLQDFMVMALDEARRCELDVPVGCVIAKDGQVIATAKNTREMENDPAGHAELNALRAAARALGTWRMSGTTVYVTLEPCPMCTEALVQARVQRIIFGAYDPAAGACGSAMNLTIGRVNLPSPDVLGGIMEDECRQLLQDFFAERR